MKVQIGGAAAQIELREVADKRRLETCAFRYQISQNMCFDITFCTGSGRRTHALQIAKNLYGIVATADCCKRVLLRFHLDFVFSDFWVSFLVNLVPANTGQ